MTTNGGTDRALDLLTMLSATVVAPIEILADDLGVSHFEVIELATELRRRVLGVRVTAAGVQIEPHDWRRANVIATRYYERTYPE